MTTEYVDQSTDTLRPDVFVTGATGLIGRWLVPALLARGHAVAALVRGGPARHAAYRDALRARGVATDRLVAMDGDLGSPGLGLRPADRARLDGVRHVHHLGARFAWGLSRREATRVNVDGTTRVVELCAELPARPRLVVVGGYRLAPRHRLDGTVHHPTACDFRFVGGYEASKFEAHRAGLAACARTGVPLTVVHPATVIGDSSTGETTQRTGLGETIVALASGRLPARPFPRRTFVPVVTVDYLAALLAGITELPESVGRTYTVLDPASPDLDGLLDRAAARLGVRSPSLRVPTGLVRMLPEALTGTSREALSFLDTARYDTTDADELATTLGLPRPDVGTSLDRWVEFLAANGRRLAEAEGIRS